VRPSWLPVLLVGAGLLAAQPGTGDELAVYRASGGDVSLFDQYDNDGYSLAVSPLPRDEGLELRVRVSGAPLSSRAPFPTGSPRDAFLPEAPDRDELVRDLVRGSRNETQAVERVLEGIAARLRYDPDRTRRQDPSSVFASRRAHCVGYSELAVDLLRRAGITARTVQGILRSAAGADGWDERIGGVYHRWVEIYYPDRGFVFSDPSASINGVDARYVPFGRRAFARPSRLRLTRLEASGALDYRLWRTSDGVLRVRPTR